MTPILRAAALTLGVTTSLYTLNGWAAPDYSADVARAMQSGDYRTARSLLRERAEAGDAEAQLNLGALVATGRGGSPDMQEAASWYRDAAEQGSAGAQYNLGTLYAQGRGVESDMTQAVNWWRKAAEQGVIAAQYNMGAANADGVGTEQSDAAAVYWFANAAQAGNERARQALDDLVPKLPTKQVTASNARVRGGANTGAEILSVVNTPTRLPVLGRTRDGWTMIYLAESAQLGWVADSLLSEQASSR